MGVKDFIFARILARGREPEAADMLFAKKLVGGGGGGGVTIVPWSTGTDEEVAAMIAAAHAGKIDLQADGGWAVGDVRSITVGAFTAGGDVSVPEQAIDIVISQFGDYMGCGCVMQFDFKGQFSAAVRMNSTGTNAGGYGASEMKTVTLPALVDALPAWLKGSLKEFSVLASAGNTSTTIETVTGNKLALRSEVEVLGTASMSAAGEGSQIEYYKTADNRKKRRPSTGLAAWWERSPYKSAASLYCQINYLGSANANTATAADGLSPFGCL